MGYSVGTDILVGVLIKAKTELFRNVHRMIFAGLSNRDRAFVLVMTEDEKASSVSAIGERMQKRGNGNLRCAHLPNMI